MAYLISGNTACTTGTAVQLQSTQQKAVWIIFTGVKATGADNGANIYIGGSDVTTAHGATVKPGTNLTFPPCADDNLYHLESTYVLGATGDTACWLALVH